MDIRAKLRAKGYSIRKAAAELNVNHSVLIQIMDKRYNGSAETIKRVNEGIEFLLIDKEDLNPIIYKNSNLFIRVMTYAMRSAKSFNDDEALLLIETISKLKRHQKHIDGKQ